MTDDAADDMANDQAFYRTRCCGLDRGDHHEAGPPIHGSLVKEAVMRGLLAEQRIPTHWPAWLQPGAKLPILWGVPEVLLETFEPTLRKLWPSCEVDPLVHVATLGSPFPPYEWPRTFVVETMDARSEKGWSTQERTCK